MTPEKAGIRVDTQAMVQQALDESHKGFIVSRAARELTGGSVHANVPVNVSYSKGAVSGFVARVEHQVDKAPQSASLDFSNGTLSKAQSHYGRHLDTQSLTLQIDNKLAQPSAAREIAAPVDKTKPKVTTAQLARQYPRVITINRSAFRLTLWHDLKPEKSYPIAVGMQGLETPAGRYNIQDKEVNPSWHVPNSAWAGSLAGQVIPPGPQDPIKARWMGIADGAGIHGTDETGSIGTAGSHGCIRMLIPDVIDLYDRVNVGDPVFIA
jgi:lipoprotein-anchoring transpeptidase ErfK/SrfK